jgi:hypothetical protein
MSLRVVSIILSPFDCDSLTLFVGQISTYNSFNVVESLASLARDCHRTVVFTNQPRSNVVALFVQLVLLAQGKLVYSGEMSQ